MNLLLCRYRPPRTPRERRCRPCRRNETLRRAVAVRLPLLAAAGALIAFGLIVHRNILPVLRTMSEHQASLVCTRIVDEAVARQLERQAADYESLVRLSRDAAGGVTAVETDAAQVGRLKTAVSQDIVDALLTQTQGDIDIALGTLLDSPFLNGRGPGVPFRLVPSNSVEATLESSFVGAGINQTLHRIHLNIHVEAQAIIPGVRTQVDVRTSYLVAETVIVGSVPEAFTAVQTLDGALPNIIADYGSTSKTPLQ